MMVRIDQPRQYQMMRKIHHFIRLLRKITGCPYLFNETITNKKTTIRYFTAVVIHCD